nr:nucleoside-diphosphate sugar epimerase/dehydratase [Kineosphaera limosa]
MGQTGKVVVRSSLPPSGDSTAADSPVPTHGTERGAGGHRSGWPLRWTRRTWPLVDAAIWVLAVYGAVWLRYDFRVDLLLTTGTAVCAALAATLQVLAGSFVGPYGVRHRRGSLEEIADLARTVLLVALPFLLFTLLIYPPPVPRSTAVTSGALALLAMLAARFVVRARDARAARNRVADRRALVFGAGNAGTRLVRGLLAEDDCAVQPVGLLDDDPTKSRLRIEGVRVLGARADLAELAREHTVDLLVLAAPTAEAGVLRELSEAAADAGLEVKVLPSMNDLVGAPTAGDLRDLDLTDILGRTPVHLDTALVADHLAGKRVLVTGAGGSIGSELCRQISRFTPSRLFLLDRDESGLQATQMSLTGHGLLDSDDIVLADIRDEVRIEAVMAATRPDVVFHAAALKHLPLLESHPGEAWATNVLGTATVLRAAAAAGVGTFVNISTDKAADPTSVLGMSKRLGEQLTAHYATTQIGRYVSVRFGNVLGSRGSVLHAFTAQIERGGPVTVTHPEVQRYFMLIPEACQLVLQASAIGADGEVMVLEMGEQVRIAEVARTLIRLSGRADIDIIYTGLRPGEKLAEELFGADEGRRGTAHPLIDCVSVPPIAPQTLTRDMIDDRMRVLARLRGLVSRAVATDPVLGPNAIGVVGGQPPDADGTQGATDSDAPDTLESAQRENTARAVRAKTSRSARQDNPRT